MLGQRHRRWANIVSTLAERLMFAEVIENLSKLLIPSRLPLFWYCALHNIIP